MYMYKVLSLKRMSLFSAPVEKDDLVYLRVVVDSYETQMMQICWNQNVLNRWAFLPCPRFFAGQQLRVAATSKCH